MGSSFFAPSDFTALTSPSGMIATAKAVSAAGGGTVNVYGSGAAAVDAGVYLFSGLTNVRVVLSPEVGLTLLNQPTVAFNSQSGGAPRCPLILVSNCTNFILDLGKAILQQQGPVQSTGNWLNGEGVWFADSCFNCEKIGGIFKNFGRFGIRFNGYYNDGTTDHSGPIASLLLRGGRHYGSGNVTTPDGGGIRLDNKTLALTGTSPQTYTNSSSEPVWVYVNGGTVSAIVVNGIAVSATSGSFQVAPGASIVITFTVQPNVHLAVSNVTLDDERGSVVMFGIDTNNPIASGRPIRTVRAIACDFTVPVSLPVTVPVPSSPTTYVNPFAIPINMVVSGGTVSAITINGVNTGQTSGTFVLTPGSTIVVTWTVAPSITTTPIQGIPYNTERVQQQDYTYDVTFIGCHGLGGFFGFQIGDGVGLVKVDELTSELALHEGVRVSPGAGIRGHDWNFKNSQARNCGQINANGFVSNEAGINVTIPASSSGNEVLEFIEFDGVDVIDDQPTKTCQYGMQIGTSYIADPTKAVSIDNLWAHGCDWHRVGVQPFIATAGAAVAIAVGSSPTTYTNPLGVPINVVVSGGTVSSITVGGTSTGKTAGTFSVPGGAAIVVTWTVAPTITMTMPLTNIKLEQIGGLTPLSTRAQLLNPAAAPNVILTGPVLGAGVVGPAANDGAGKGSWVFDAECVVRVTAYTSGSPLPQLVWQDENGTAHTISLILQRVDASPETEQATAMVAVGIYTWNLKGVRVNSVNAPKIQIAGTGTFELDIDARLTIVPQQN